MKMNKSIKTLLPLAAFAGLTFSANAAVYSFNLQGGVISGDMGTGTNGANDNGLQITGTTADWSIINTGTPSATNNGVTLTFVPTNGWQNTTGTRGDVVETIQLGVGAQGIRIGTHLAGVTDIAWTITGLTPGAFYDMTWYNKNTDQTRRPNTGVAGFDAGNGVGASGTHDADGDQDFIGVEAVGGTISGTWFLAGGAEDISAVAGVQIVDAVPEPTTTALLGLGGLALILRRRK